MIRDGEEDDVLHTARGVKNVGRNGTLVQGGHTLQVLIERVM